MAKTGIVKLEPDVRAVLERGRIEGNNFYLPAESLPRALYEKVNKILNLCGGKWNKHAKAHVFSGDPTEKLGLTMQAGGIRDTKKELQQFFTPEPLALRLAELAELNLGDKVLEPSAGGGAIMKAISEHGGEPHGVEIDRELHLKLVNASYKVVCMDFLKMRPDFLPEDWGICSPFNAVVMNPPFTGDQDLAHVMHSLNFVRRGGLVVAITSPGWTFGETKVRKEFREFMRDHKWYKVEVGAFKESGTQVGSMICVIRKR